ncbi:hypothetical protein LWI29_016591 [Acer saccharum]|uniref:Uncharacterized protein n=1 Tax=Acer saccharum TaxID=4024 RepID=A0AA39VNE4_ACESA|nr:hypothetical protein LWI29_016591 [Acer saccharum]
MAKVNVNDVVEGIDKQLKLSEDSLVLSENLKLLRFCILGCLFLLFQFAIFKGMEIWFHPTPQELIGHYLRKKRLDPDCSVQKIEVFVLVAAALTVAAQTVGAGVGGQSMGALRPGGLNSGGYHCSRLSSR